MSLELADVHCISKTHQISSTFDFRGTKNIRDINYCLTSRERCLLSDVMLTPLHVGIILLEHRGLLCCLAAAFTDSYVIDTG